MELEDVRRNWTKLGAEDPLWAVYVAPGTQNGRWDVEQFRETGRTEVGRSLDRLAELGIAVGDGTALDFGCGVGRLSGPLAERFSRVVAVDVAPSMLERAREMDISGGRIDWVLNEAPDLSFQPEDSIDLVYTSLVLQHLPRELALSYVREFVRVLRPGGVAVMQVASRTTPSVKGWAFRHLPPALLGWAQKTLLRYPAPMLMTALTRADIEAVVRPMGAAVVDVQEDPTYGGHWVYERLVVRADG